MENYKGTWPLHRRVVHRDADDPDAIPAMKLMFGTYLGIVSPEGAPPRHLVKWDCDTSTTGYYGNIERSVRPLSPGEELRMRRQVESEVLSKIELTDEDITHYLEELPSAMRGDPKVRRIFQLAKLKLQEDGGKKDPLARASVADMSHALGTHAFEALMIENSFPPTPFDRERIREWGKVVPRRYASYARVLIEKVETEAVFRVGPKDALGIAKKIENFALEDFRKGRLVPKEES